MSGAGRQRALAAGLAGLAIAVAALALPAIWRLPRVVAWRYRGRLEELCERATGPAPGSAPYVAAAHLLALDLARDPRPESRMMAAALLRDDAIRAGAGADDRREAGRALLALLDDTRPIGPVRVCDGVVEWLGTRAPSFVGEARGPVEAVELRDARRADARARLEKELSAP
jgi:hypothetical protein